MTCRQTSPYVQWVMYISTEHNSQLKFSIQTHVTHINTISEYFHASLVLDSVDVLYLEDGTVYRSRSVLKNKPKNISSIRFFVLRFHQIQNSIIFYTDLILTASFDQFEALDVA